ncbi:receptor-type tyrosine-protein phosphatase R-like [Littorina saxatilis]|uniref:receptor-type tyrosine-protein phosphatase R-like n=1 Tax=Littorina saxatilis TaxID=31220 RepID=UPI0038B64210
MKRKRLFPTAFLNTVFVLLTGTLENGERSVDAASFVPRLHQQRQIDQTFDQKRSRLSRPDQPRGYSPKMDNMISMHMVDVFMPQISARVLGTAELGDINSGDDETSGRTRRIRLKRRAPASKAHSQNQRHPAASEYGVVVTLGEAVKNPNRSIDDAMQRMRQAFAQVLDWPADLIHVEKINFAGNVVELSFFRPEVGSDMQPVPVPAKEILKHPNLLQELQNTVPELKIQQLTHEHGIIYAVYDSPVWMQPYFPYIVAGGSILVVFVLGITTYACFCRAKDGMDLSNSPESLGSQTLYHQQQQQQQQHVLYPDVTPDLGSPLAIQPCAAPIFVPVGFVTTPVPAQPVRKKRKGLLESRRGSNASLTLDLQASPDMRGWDGTPPKESTGLEFLMSAGNRLSRRDLRNAAKNTKVLYEEFWEIPMNHPEKVSVAGSGMKNRYKTIIPNEHSRVILPDADQDPLTAYINANYIRGYEGEQRAYIATQGPMAHTIVDFWLMIWHERTPIIVMITKLKEKSKPKCENYLPENHGVYGDIEVTVAKIIQKRGYVVRHLHLKFGGESRTLLHFWYTTWPDHKPPDSPSMLLDLIKEVELRRFKPDGISPRGPVVVHCSAGIGRTGCFVGISIGIRQLREEHSVDVLGIVCGMRLDRGGMVQTHEQYDFVHQALLEYERTLGEPSIQSLTALTSDGH